LQRSPSTGGRADGIVKSMLEHSRNTSGDSYWCNKRMPIGSEAIPVQSRP
jgi:hypothetical protein